MTQEDEADALQGPTFLLRTHTAIAERKNKNTTGRRREARELSLDCLHFFCNDNGLTLDVRKSTGAESTDADPMMDSLGSHILLVAPDGLDVAVHHDVGVGVGAARPSHSSSVSQAGRLLKDFNGSVCISRLHVKNGSLHTESYDEENYQRYAGRISTTSPVESTEPFELVFLFVRPIICPCRARAIVCSRNGTYCTYSTCILQ